MGTSSGLGEVLRYAQLPFFGSKLAGRMCNFPNIAVTPASSSAVAGRGDGARALVTEVTGSDVTSTLSSSLTIEESHTICIHFYSDQHATVPPLELYLAVF